MRQLRATRCRKTAAQLCAAGANRHPDFAVAFYADDNGNGVADLAEVARTAITDNPTAGNEGILVWDAIPAGTALAATTADGQPQAGPNGFVVYSGDAGTTWYRTEAGAGGAAAVNRVGFFLPDAPANDTDEAVLTKDQQGFLSFRVVIDDPYTQASLCGTT